jgi:two-component system response regulator HydG
MRVRDTSEPVVLFGEEGSGRRFVARAIHYSGARRARGFSVVEARFPTAEGLEATLFGEVGGGRRRRGLIERTNGGSLHVAGAEHLGPELLRRLPQLLDGGGVGAHDGHDGSLPQCRMMFSLDVPAVDLGGARKLHPGLGALQELVTIHVPPLRHRLEDLPGLVAAFLEEHAAEHGQSLQVGPRVIELLAAHSFARNVRELFAVLAHCANLSVDGVLTSDNLERSLRQSNLSAQKAIADHLGDREYQLVLRAVQRNPGRLDQAARELGVSRTTLWRRMRKYGIRLAMP